MSRKVNVYVLKLTESEFDKIEQIIRRSNDNLERSREAAKKKREESKKNFEIIHGYDFGGYAKHTPALIKYMNECYKNMEVPLDFVYTAKLMYAVGDLATKGKFEPLSKMLLIHSGGLQGNRSFKKGTLNY
jgi:1-aminocyclopropane-1-carboxylate deaminase/D-cysteine desulfhydrase-like pyridoxal-dependent ACC family enzyme